MPFRKKESPYWWITYQDPTGSGKRISRSSGTTDHRQAKLLEDEMQLNIRKAQRGQQPDIYVEQVLLTFLQDHAQRPSHRTDKTSIKHLLTFFKGTNIQDLQKANILQYQKRRQSQNMANATINKECGLLSSAIKHTSDKLGFPLNTPFQGTKLKEPPGRVVWLSAEERQRLLAAAVENTRAPWLQHFIIIALETGMRKGEILKLTWDRVDLQKGWVYLPTGSTKTDQPRMIPLNTLALDAFQALLQFKNKHQLTNSHVFTNKSNQNIKDVKRSFDTARKKAGLPHFRIHDQRHDISSHMAMGGESLYIIKELLGHSSIKSTERYAHLQTDNIKAAVNRKMTATKSLQEGETDEGK